MAMCRPPPEGCFPATKYFRMPSTNSCCPKLCYYEDANGNECVHGGDEPTNEDLCESKCEDLCESECDGSSDVKQCEDVCEDKCVKTSCGDVAIEC